MQEGHCAEHDGLFNPADIFMDAPVSILSSTDDPHASVIGNEAADVATLIARCDRVVFKIFYPQNWQSESSGRRYEMTAVPLDASTPPPDAAIGVSPGIYQCYIDKVF